MFKRKALFPNSQATHAPRPQHHQMVLSVRPPRYHLKDVIVGKIYFLLVRIKIQHMELQLIKREMTGIGKLGV